MPNSEKTITLPKAPSAEMLALLQRARLMFTHATEHASAGTEFDGMIAILGLDNTIEYVLRVISAHLDLESVTGESFDIVDLASLAGSINKALTVHAGLRLPYVAEIKLLRQTRNLVQHGAVSPAADLARFRTVTERFFAQVLEKIFGVPLRELMISAVVRNPVVQAHLRRAEIALEEGKWLESVAASRDAFENAYFERIRSSEVTLSLYPALVKAEASRDISSHFFETIVDEAELSRLGINTEDYRRFREYLRHIPSEYYPEGAWVLNVVMQRPWYKDDAMFCYAFAGDAVLRWQAKEKPPLYKIPHSGVTYTFVEHMGDVEISGEASVGGCSYSFEDNNRVQLWYCDGKKRRELENLAAGTTCLFVSERFANNKKDHEYRVTVEMVGQHARLVTCNPERWSVVLWYRIIREEESSA